MITVINPKVERLGPILLDRVGVAKSAVGAAISRGRRRSFYVTPDLVIGFPEAQPEPFWKAEGLIKRCLGKKPHPHETVIEHGTMTLAFTVSRIASYEIVRHRLASITQKSTRYCIEKSNTIFIRPPHVAETDIGEYEHMGAMPAWCKFAAGSLNSYRALFHGGVPQESARYLLPHCLATEMVFTANFREWRHVLNVRASGPAAPEVVSLFQQVWSIFETVSPVLTHGLYRGSV